MLEKSVPPSPSLLTCPSKRASQQFSFRIITLLAIRWNSYFYRQTSLDFSNYFLLIPYTLQEAVVVYCHLDSIWFRDVMCCCTSLFRYLWNCKVSCATLHVLIIIDTFSILRSDAAATIYFAARFVWLLFEGSVYFFGKPRDINDGWIK